MKKTNKLISILLVMVMLLSMAPLSLTASAASEAITLKKDSYTKVDYSNSATQYYQYNNYLYKAAYSNLKNISEVAICYSSTNYLRLNYTESDTGDIAWVFLKTSYRGSSAKLSNLPTAPGNSVDFYTSFEAIFVNEKNPVVTVTCMAVNEPVWSWSDSSATAAFTSTDGKATMTVTAAIESSEQTAATCLENDKTTYTATATANGKAYTNEKTVDGEQGPHSFEYSGDDVIGRCTNGCGYECPHKNQTGETCEICGAVLHTHSFTYTASGDTITAVCANADGNCPDPEGTLTILAPADLYVDGTAKEATVENNLPDDSAAVGDIIYSAPYGLPPKDAGTYTASVTVGGATVSVEFELVKRSAAADNFIYTAPENLVYDGTSKYATVEVSPEITGMGAITVIYYKDGEAVEPVDAGTYTVKVSTADSDKYYAINDVELASFTINAKDISDGFIILGDALTYNGTEQTQTVEKVLPTGTAPEATYSVSGNKATNVGVYLLTVTGTGNFTGEAKIAYEIAVDASAVEGLTIDYVKSTDKENVEYVYSQLENAVKDLADEDKISEWNTLQSCCAAMRQRIEIVENQIEAFENKLGEYDINTVTSDDTADLESFQNSIGKFNNDYYDNLTDEQKKTIIDIYSAIEDLETRISDVAEEITRLTNAVNGYDEATVKSSDKSDLEQLVADIKVLTDGQNITADERAKLGNLDATADTLLAKIAETTAEYDRVIAAANGYDEATVTSADKDALVQLNDDIYALALTDNVTAEEKENLENAHNKVLGLIDKLTAISDEIKRIIEAVDKYVFESVKSSDKADIEQLIADIKALLDTKNITADERALLEGADETCTKLIEKIDETVAEISRINDATNAYDEATVKYSDYKDILQLIDDIEALTDGQNITDDERASLEELNTKANLLAAKIRSTADEISRITRAVNAYNIDTVKSSDKADIENLIARIKKLTDGDNITSDERTNLNELDSTLDSLLAKIDDTTAEIERIDEAVNGYDKETVTSDDVPELGKLIDDIKALTDSDNLTDDERTALEANNEAIDELVEKLAEVAEEIKKVDEAVKSYDEDSVKSTDKEDLAQLKEDAQSLIDSTNTTENEKTALGEMIEKVEALEEKIKEIEQQLENIGDFKETFNPETVSSDDKAAIEDKIAEIEAVNPDNLTDEQKAEYEEIKAGLEALLEEIAAAEKDVADIGVELDMFDEERVTIFWEDDIEALKSKIDELLADENMGKTEKAKLNEYKAQAEKLIEIINTPKEYFSLRFFYLIWDCLTWKYNGILWLFSKIFSC